MLVLSAPHKQLKDCLFSLCRFSPYYWVKSKNGADLDPPLKALSQWQETRKRRSSVFDDDSQSMRRPNQMFMKKRSTTNMPSSSKSALIPLAEHNTFVFDLDDKEKKVSWRLVRMFSLIRKVVVSKRLIIWRVFRNFFREFAGIFSFSVNLV